MSKKKTPSKRDRLRPVEGEPSGGKRYRNRAERIDETMDQIFQGDADQFEEKLREHVSLLRRPRLEEVTDDAAGAPSEPGPEPENLAGGSWFPIQFTPDPVSGEALNIGVGYISPTGRLTVRLVEQFSRLRWLYRDEWSLRDIGYLLRGVWASFREHADGADLPDSPSQYIIYGRPKLVGRDDTRGGVDGLFRRKVMLSRCGDLGPDD